MVGATSYVIRWRRTDSNQWEKADAVTFTAEQEAAMVKACLAGVPPGLLVDCAVRSIGKLLPGVRVDDWVFGVSSVSKDGFESPVASAVPGGAFKPYIAPPKEEKK